MSSSSMESSVMSSSLDFTFTASPSLPQPTIKFSEGSSSALTSISRTTSLAVAKKSSFLDHTSCGGWFYYKSARREPYIAVWPNDVTGNRCKESGASLRGGRFNFNNAKEVSCLLRGHCKQREGRLTIIEKGILDVVRNCKHSGQDVGLEEDMWFNVSSTLYYTGGGPLR